MCIRDRVVVGGVIGFHLIMRMQMVITIVTGVLTLFYIALVLGHIDLTAVGALPAGDVPHVIGGFVFMLSLIHISEPTRLNGESRMTASA